MLSPSLTDTIDGLPMMERKAFGTKRSIEVLVSRRSRIVRRTASRMVAKLVARWPISSRRLGIGDGMIEIAVGDGARLAAQSEQGVQQLLLQETRGEPEDQRQGSSSTISEYYEDLITAWRARLTS